MTPERWQRLERLFESVRNLGPKDREDYLDKACDDDLELRRMVQSLVVSDENLGSMIDRGFDFAPSTTRMPVLPMSSERIGPYRILSRLGEGGMGTVYEVEQEEPVRRRAALKLIRHGLDDAESLARFEGERQALAVMSHTNIARIFDAGTTDSGLPYFVMELVPGEPITSYCDRNQLDLSARIQLFLSVCEGLRHAHEKGVIHRDIKPSNVLITTEGDTAVPKIIDFGVSKVVGEQALDTGPATRVGSLVGTPQYMSPEQAGGSTNDIDTRTDVYALGVLLYELLTGALPFHKTGGDDPTLEELCRRIREDEPTPPSRQQSKLAGDLDWIVLKTLSKDRSHRYESPSALAADLRRHLASEPVLAGPPSPVYRARKFIRRHRIGVTVSAVLLFSLLGGLGLAWTGLVKAKREAVRADRETKTAEATISFLIDTFGDADPSKAQGDSITAREILDKGAERIKTAELNPEVRARLLVTLGSIYTNLGRFDRAEPLLREATEMLMESDTSTAIERVVAHRRLAWVFERSGQYELAEDEYRELLTLSRQSLPDGHSQAIEIAREYSSLLTDRAQFGEAVSVLEQAIELASGQRGTDDESVLRAKGQLATTLLEEGQPARAVPILVDLVERRSRALGADHPKTLTAKGNLGSSYIAQGLIEKAEIPLIESFEGRKRVLGGEHPATLWNMQAVAYLRLAQGKAGEAEDLYRQAWGTYKKVLGEEHRATLRALAGLADAIRKQDRLEEAETIFRNVLEIRTRVLGADHVHTLATVQNLAELRIEAVDLTEARTLFEQLLFVRARLAGNPEASAAHKRAYAKSMIACSIEELRDLDTALTFALAAAEETTYSEPSYLETLAKVHQARGETERAAEVVEKALSLMPQEGDPGQLSGLARRLNKLRDSLDSAEE